MGGYKVPKTTEDFIVNIYWELKSEYGKRPTAQKLLDTVKGIIEFKKIKDIYPPSLRKIGYIIADTEECSKSLPPTQQLQQESWSMVSLEKFPLTSESIPHVLQLWRYSMALDIKFTIRQAKWASRLYGTNIQNNSRLDITELYFVSRRYSHEEELSLLSNSEMIIFTLDSSLVMGNWELRNALVTDILKPKPMLYIKHTIIPYGSDGGIVEEFINAVPSPEYMKTEKEWERAHKIREAIQALPSSNLYFEDFETRMVYLRQLSFIAKGPKWNTLAPEEIFNIIVDLRSWTIETKERIDNPPIKSAKSILGISFDRTPFPNHLYTRAGYNY